MQSSFSNQLDRETAKSYAEDPRFLIIEMSSWSMPSQLVRKSYLFVNSKAEPKPGESIYFADNEGRTSWADSPAQIPPGAKILGPLVGIFSFPPTVDENRIQQIRKSLQNDPSLPGGNGNTP